jgi:drug/metabolite transporter (DMT)-like permease
MCFISGFANSSHELTSSVFTTVSVGYLILSSTLGIIVGDVLWLEALCILGAKHVIVIDSIKPFGAAVLGRIVLDEVLTRPAWGGMFLTVIGVGVVAWEEQRLSTSTKAVEEKKVISNAAVENTVEQMDDSSSCSNERDQNDVTHEEQTSSPSIINQPAEYQNVSVCNSMKRIDYKRGYVCAIVNVLADSLGSLITKKYGVGMTTWSINLIRFGFAGLVLVGISTGMRLKQRVSRSSKTKYNDDATNKDDACPTPQWFELPMLTRREWLKITTGVGLVTFLCPALSNYSLFQIALGLAVSLGSVGPIYGLILDWPFKGKKPTLHGCIGVFFAVAGVVVLCLWGTTKT